MGAWLPPIGTSVTRNNFVMLFVRALIFLFPILAVTAPHGATNPFGLLFVLALFCSRRGWARLHSREKQVLVGFMAYAVLVGLSMLVASRDLDEAVDGYSKFLRFLAFAPMYIMVRRFDLELSWPLIAGVVIGALIMCIQVVVQHYMLAIEQPGGSRDPVQFGDVLMLCTMLVVLAVATRFTRPWQYAVGLGAIAAGLFASYVSVTRNAWLLAPAVFLLLMAYYRNRMTKLGYLLLAASLMIGAALVMHPDSLVRQEFESGFHDIRLFMDDPSQTTSWGIRLNMWRNALIIFTKSPWFGVGLDDYDEAAKAVIGSGTSYSRDPILYHQAHNAYIHTLAESGLFAMLAFVIGVLIMPLIAFLRHWRTSRKYGYAFEVLGGLTVVLAFAIFGIGHAWMGSNNFISVYLLFMLVFLSGVARAADASPARSSACGRDTSKQYGD